MRPLLINLILPLLNGFHSSATCIYFFYTLNSKTFIDLKDCFTVSNDNLAPIKQSFSLILHYLKGSFISFQLVPDTPARIFLLPATKNLTKSKTSKFYYMKILLFLSCQIFCCWEEENLSLECLAPTETR